MTTRPARHAPQRSSWIEFDSGHESWHSRRMTTTAQVVGANLHAQRVQRGWTQAQVAHKVHAYGLSWNSDHVSNLEKGARETVRLDELLILSAAFGVPLAVWFKGEGDVVIAGHTSLSRAEMRQALTGEVPMAEAIVVDFEKAEDQLIADRRAAERLGVPEHRVTAAAVKLWGHTLTQERDRRLGSSDARNLRAGMTKRLIREIAPHVRADE